METPDSFLYRRYKISLEFINGLAGGTPADPQLIAGHIAKFSAEVTNSLKLSKKVEGEVSEEAMKKYMLQCQSVFPLDQKGIYVNGYQFNAMLKDAAQRTKATIKHKGLGNTIRDGGVLFPIKVYLGVDPTIVERPVKPDYGPANIKQFQVAEHVTLSIPCAVLNNGDLDDNLWRQLWIVSQGIGLGANRHLGYGRFRLAGIKEEGDWDIAGLWEGDTRPDMSPVPESAGGSSKRKATP